MSLGLGLSSSGVGSRKGYVLAPNPKVLSATLGTDGETLTIVFDKTMAAGSDQVGMRVWENGKFGDSVAAVYDSGAASDTLVFATDSVFPAAVILKLGYTQPGDGFVSGSDLLLSFSGKNVINNSSQVVDPPVFNVDPTVTGSTAPGSTLTRTLGSTSGGESVTGQWFKNGVGTGITTSTYSDTVDGDSMKWRSSATNGGGTTTADSNIVAVATPSAGASMTVAFDISGYETGYTHRVELTPSDAADKTLAAGVNSWTFSGLAYNAQYQVDVIRIDGSLNESSPITVDIYTSPEFGPTDFAAVADGSDTINLSWTEPDPAPATGYQLQISDDDSTWADLDDVASGQSSYAVNGLDYSTTRYFRIRAWNSNPSPHDDAVLAWSSSVSATTDADITAPTVVSASVNKDKLTLNWSEPATGSSTYLAAMNVDLSTTGNNIAISSHDSGNGTATWGMTLASSAVIGESANLDFAGGTDLIQDDAGNDMAAITDVSVTNLTSFYFVETFDSVGYDNPVWTEVVTSTGTIDPNYTGVVLSGTKTLRINAPDSDVANVYATLPGDMTTAYVYFQLNMPVLPAVGSHFFELQSSGGTIILSLELYTADKVRFRVGSANQTTADAIVAGTTYHFWVRYTAGGDADAVASAGFATTSTEATSGTKYVSLTNGTSTASARRLFFGRSSSGTSEYLVDRVIANPTTIGSAP